jgi:hypothetical protein
LLVIGLAAVSTTACDHGTCVASGMPECSSMNEIGCKQTPHCRWDTACVLLASCYGASQTVCEGLDYCSFNPNSESCQPTTTTTDPCESLTVETCASDKRCGLTPACVGTPVPCATYADEDSCEADLHCDWSSRPAF